MRVDSGMPTSMQHRVIRRVMPRAPYSPLILGMDKCTKSFIVELISSLAVVSIHRHPSLGRYDFLGSQPWPVHRLEEHGWAADTGSMDPSNGGRGSCATS